MKMPEKDRLAAEWNESRQRMTALHLELDHPTASRLYGVQMKLLKELKAAKDECYNRFVALRNYPFKLGSYRRSCVGALAPNTTEPSQPLPKRWAAL